MNENRKGYWVYSVITVIIFVILFAFFAWLIYDLIIRLSEKDFSNNTVVQALITLLITVFIGGFFSKWLEKRNIKAIELYKIQTTLSLNLIDLASEAMHRPKDKTIHNLLIRESSKVKLYFPDDVLKELNTFINSDDKSIEQYNKVIDELRKGIK